MIVNNDFFVEQYSEQFVTFFARNISVRSKLSSHKSRQNFLFSFFLMNRIFTSFSEYVQWIRQNASAIFRENKKKFKNYDKKNAILINSETYIKIIIIKTNEVIKMRKFFLHKCECLTYSNESTQFWKKKLNEIYKTKNKFVVELCFATLYYALWNKNLCSEHYKIIKWFLNLKYNDISKLILKNLNDFWRTKKKFYVYKKNYSNLFYW